MHIRVLVVEPCKEPIVKEINNTLEDMQEIVGGYIEMIYPNSHKDDAVIVCNEEGKLKGLKLNRPIMYRNGMSDIILGTFIVCSAPETSDEFESLTDKQIEIYTQMYKR